MTAQPKCQNSHFIWLVESEPCNVQTKICYPLERSHHHRYAKWSKLLISCAWNTARARLEEQRPFFACTSHHLRCQPLRGKLTVRLVVIPLHPLSSAPRPGGGGGWESIWAPLLSVSCFICFFVLKKRRKHLSRISCIETLAQKLLQCSYSAPSIPALNGLLSPNHWHDRNCGYHVTGGYCRLGGIRTFSHRLWTQYIFTETAELLDHSDPAT